MELYKSIFLSDSEEEEENVETKNKELSYEDFIDVPSNVERNTSPPRGIFANINFDELNSWNRNPQTDEKEIIKDDNTTTSTDKVNSDIEIDSNMYGPKLPDKLQKNGGNYSNVKNNNELLPKFKNKLERHKELSTDSSSSDSWVDVKDVSKKLKKKKSKHKKHKSKHKKSKRKKKE